MDCGKRIKILRMLHGLTQGELAILSGVERTTLARVEAGKTALSDSSCQKLAKVMGVAPSYLTQGYPRVFGAVWSPLLPLKQQHKNQYKSDMQELFSFLIKENHFDIALSHRLQDGAAIFLGIKPDLDCLLLLPEDIYIPGEDLPPLKSLEITNTCLLSDFTPEYLATDAEAISNHGLNLRISPISARIRHLRHIQKKTPIYSKEVLKIIIRVYLDLSQKFVLDYNDMHFIVDCFLYDYERLCHEHHSDIAIFALIENLTAKMENTGFKRRA